MKKLLYRVVPHNGGAVFAEPARARHVARIHQAINQSRTWGEFRVAMAPADYSEVVRSAFDEQGERRARSTDRFDGESVPGWTDGIYPSWLQPEMDWLLPEAVLRQFGKRQDTWGNGSFWMIPEENLGGMCDALAALGWQLQREQELPFH